MKLFFFILYVVIAIILCVPFFIFLGLGFGTLYLANRIEDFAEWLKKKLGVFGYGNPKA